MRVRIGTDNISPSQARALEDARAGISPTLLIRTLESLAQDPDIRSGDETLHPYWVDLYNSNKKILEPYLAPYGLRRLREFYGSLPTLDPAVAEIDPENTSITFLLGAGASKPDPSGIPTVLELLPDLLSRARRLDREDVSRLADFCETSGITNIEDLLTAAQISEFCSRNNAVFGLVDFLLYRRQHQTERGVTLSEGRLRRTPVDLSSVAFLQDTLQVLFGLLSSRMLPAKPNPAHMSIADYVAKHSGSAIVTTNYDCCMDLALGKHPQSLRYLIDFANDPEAKSEGEVTSLIKLHGSLNWFYCDTCQQVHLIDIEATVAAYLADRAAYPVIGVCKDCGGQRRGLLVPPLAMKFDVAPPLNPLLQHAQTAFNRAELIIVVGFSFADADLYISRMVSKAMQASKPRKILIFDPEPAVVQKVRRQFGARIPHFDAKRILWVPGDCAKELPKFLSGQMLEPKSAKPSASTGRRSSKAKMEQP